MATFTLPSKLLASLTHKGDARAIGHALGTMLYHVSPLVITHLEHSTSHVNQPPRALAWAPEYISSVDAYVAHMRHEDSLVTAFSEFPTCRKERAKKARVAKQYAAQVEGAFKEYVRAAFRDIFTKWGRRETQLFNKGVDKGVSGIQWVVYPELNVVVEAGEEDCAVWLRRMCEVLALVEVDAGRPGLESL